MSTADFRAQTEEFRKDDEKMEWYRGTAAQFKAEGATFFRYSYHPDNGHLIQVEGWRVQPEDQGEIEWALCAGLVATVSNTEL